MTEPQEPRSATPNHLTSEELSECAFSPETAAAAWLEHAEGCAACAAELADLRLLLAQLAELPEPELPESVGIRLDAALARAWQEADAEQEAAAAAKASAGARRGARRPWRKIAIPLGSLALIVLAIIGVGSLLHNDAGSSSSASSGPAAAVPNSESNGPATSETLAQWVKSVLTSSGTAAGRARVSPFTKNSAMANSCEVIAPQRAGYTVLTTSQRVFEGVPATLVVYQNAQKPSSSTVYAVVYEGSCLSSQNRVLTEGFVSR